MNSSAHPAIYLVQVYSIAPFTPDEITCFRAVDHLGHNTCLQCWNKSIMDKQLPSRDGNGRQC
jgi:hypothetical protein